MHSDHNIKDLGNINSPLLIFGGAYSNLAATLKLRELATKQGFSPQQIICTGDSVGYCAQPEETVTCLREWGIHSIAGNVELQLRRERQDCGCNFQKGSRCDQLSTQWYGFAKKNISATTKKWFDTLPDFLTFSFAGKKVMVVHGAYSHVSKFIFASTPWEQKQQEFAATRADIILAGHSGLPFQEEKEGKIWANAGVIGMPANDGTPRVWYALLQEVNGKIIFQHKSFLYKYEHSQNAMHKAALPNAYIKTLHTGLWDNCDILPPQENAHRGIALRLSCLSSA